jgi:hypothetical protein
MMRLKTAPLLLLLLLAPACTQIEPAARTEVGLQKIAAPLLREVRVDPRLGRNMFGLDLRPEARILWAEIEAHYGRPVRELLIDNLDYPYYAGLASIDPDGTPVVELKNSAPVTEERIVHELYHLKLYADGFPVIRIEYPAAWKGERQQARVRYIMAQIYDSIEHWIFYPQMRQMGLMPDDTLKSNVEFILEGGTVDDDVPGVTRRDSLTIEYFEAALLLDDEQLQKLLPNHYRRRRWDDELNTGKAMAELVRAARPSTPKEAVTTLMRCLALIERTNNVYELSGWETEKIGELDLGRIYLKVRPKSKGRGRIFN